MSDKNSADTFEISPTQMDVQAKTHKAYQLLAQCIKDYPEIESNIWANAFLSCIVNAYVESDIPYSFFCQELDAAKVHYKTWFEK